MATTPLGAIFTTEILVLLLLLVVNTYFLSRPPVLLHIREIFFVNSHRLRQAWYLVIAAVTLFVVAQFVRTITTDATLDGPGDESRMFELAFATLMLLALAIVVTVLSRYIPRFGASDDEVEVAIQRELRRRILDEDDTVELDVSIGQDIYEGRRILGPTVSLSHYRGVVLGMTQYMEDRFGELGDPMLNAVGRKTGRRAAQDMLEEDADRHAVLEGFLRTLQTAQVGIPEVINVDEHGADVRLTECAICAGIRPTGHPECHYITGALHGLFETLYDDKVEAEETQCASRGDAACQFRIRRQQP